MATRKIGDLLAAYKPPTRSVPICFEPGLIAEYVQAAAELAAARRQVDSIAGGDDADLAERVETLKAQIADASEMFVVKALSQAGWSDLVARCPDENPDESARLAFDIPKMVVASIAACTVDPEITPEEAAELCDTLPKPEIERLSNTIWELNNTGADIPFDVAAFVKALSPGEK